MAMNLGSIPHSTIASSTRWFVRIEKLVLFIMLIILATLFAFVFITSCPTYISGHSIVLNEDNRVNNYPIIGVLSQELSYKLRQHYFEYDSYIAASYVKFIEGAGARVVPIWIGKSTSYYENILGKINGILWPGGATNFSAEHGYAEAGSKIYEIAERMNKKGDYFPILGICLGFELLTFVAADNVDPRIKCDSQSQPLPLEFVPDYGHSRMFNNTPTDVIDALKNKNVTANFHQFCVTKTSLKRVGANKQFRILSLNHDRKGAKFISSLEHVTLPFYGLQFHPEKNMYEWVKGKGIPHGQDAVRVGQYFANFFVNEARKSEHKFPNPKEERESLIYNYPVTYTGMMNSSFVQCYMFKRNETKNAV